jgi:hypothetical protein
MRRVIILLVSGILGLLTGSCGGNPELDVRTFDLEHRSGYEAAELVDPYVFRDREGAPGSISATGDAISVRETRDNLDRIARVLEAFDTPVPSIRLRFRLIEADSFEDPDPTIAEVVDELRSLFRFDGYRLLGEALVSLGGDAGTQRFSQRFLGTDEVFRVASAAQLRGPERIRLTPVELWLGDDDLLLETSVTVSPGQTLVIGGAQARIGGRSFILTLTAESE